jgi:hypothetical protein
MSELNVNFHSINDFDNGDNFHSQNHFILKSQTASLSNVTPNPSLQRNCHSKTSFQVKLSPLLESTLA